ncbi:MAG: nucleoside phosphorylase [Acidobacteriaceae bacterium]
MKRLGIVAALPGELKPLVSGWKKADVGVWTGVVAGRECVAVAGGMGADAATRACERVFAAGPVDALISVGWAGALSCGVKPPEAFEVKEVVDPLTGERFLTGQEQGFRLVTLDHVAVVKEKRQLAEKYRAVLVDMEAATVARLAQGRGVAFLCCKGISDGSTDVLPDFSRFISAKGQLRMGALLAHVAVRPRYWKSLARMGSNSQQAAVALGELIKEVVERI